MAKTLVWAVDALELEQEFTESALEVLRPLSEHLAASVQPVYVLTPNRSGATEYSQIDESLPEDGFRPDVKKMLDEAMQRAGISSLLNPLVIPVESTSLQVAIEALSRYADSVDAEAIIVSSHGRSGLGRLFLGSFAETLMSHAHRQVIVVHPGTKMRGLKKMLFPTNLGERSHRYFLQALDLARDLGAEIHIFHCTAYSVEPFLQSGIYLFSGGWMPIPEPSSEQIQPIQSAIDHWANEARRVGVPATGSIYSLGGGIADTILRVATQNEMDLIALSVQTGPITAALLGSIAREVVRRSLIPTVVLKTLDLKRHVDVVGGVEATPPSELGPSVKRRKKSA